MLHFIIFCSHSSIMSAASTSGSAALGFEDYSLYDNLNDDELLQLAIERSLTDTHCSNTNTTRNSSTTSNPDKTSKTTCTTSPATSRHRPESSMNPAAQNTNQPLPKHSQNPTLTQTTAHYSSPNPPAEKPPDPYVSSHSFNISASRCEYFIVWRTCSICNFAQIIRAEKGLVNWCVR